MYYSFIMGIDNVETLGNGFNIKKVDKYYEVSFTKEQVLAYEEFITKNMNNGFWNEYIGDKIVFIFKFQDGNIKKYILNDDNHDEVLSLCCQFAQTEFTSIESMLTDNDFYKDKEIKWN